MRLLRRKQHSPNLVKHWQTNVLCIWEIHKFVHFKNHQYVIITSHVIDFQQLSANVTKLHLGFKLASELLLNKVSSSRAANVTTQPPVY